MRKDFDRNYRCQPVELPICPMCQGKPKKRCEICKGESLDLGYEERVKYNKER